MQTTTVSVFVVVVALACVSMVSAQGGGMLSDMNKNESTGIAMFAVGTMGTSYKLVKVTKAQKQVVSGKMYHLTMQVTQKNPVNGAKKNLSCDIKVYERYDSIKDLTSFCCNNL